MMDTHEAHASYVINVDTHYAPLERIDIQVLVNACQGSWYNQTLSQVNDCVVRLGIMQGVFLYLDQVIGLKISLSTQILPCLLPVVLV